MNTIDIVRIIARNYPDLKKNIRISHFPVTAEKFVKRSLFIALYLSAALTAFTFFLFANRLGIGMLLFLWMAVVFVLSYIVALNFLLLTPKGFIRKRQRDIDKDVLFAGRYIMVKMDSGAPLYNSLIEASKSYGVAGKYFKEIVDEVSTGIPLEKALANAREYTPSEKFKRILWQILLALKTGTDVSGALRTTLRTITADQIIEIRAYGKKLNSVLLFYMVVACVAPSLGMTMFFILASIIGLTVTPALLFLLLFMFAFFQLSFVFLIRSIRPTVDI